MISLLMTVISAIQKNTPSPLTGLFEIFKISVGPSSSHTLGPMVAAGHFRGLLEGLETVPSAPRLRVRLYGSLAATGRGHATDRAVIAGLSGIIPADADPEFVDKVIGQVLAARCIVIGRCRIRFSPDDDIE
jgi:L-serine dehydratase